jgi:S1-C subfamily serine protease
MKTALTWALALALLPLSRFAQGVERESLDRVASEDPAYQRRRSVVVDVVERARPAVVSIDSNIPHVFMNIFGQTFQQEQGVSGTGVIVFEDGYIVTNNHVVADGDQVATRIVVRFDQEDDEKEYEATLISQQPEEDLALIKIQGDHLFPIIPLSDAEPLLGETVIAIGNAVGQTHTVSTGIISGLHRDIPVPSDMNRRLRFRSLIQTDAAINPGNSGGPLMNVNGELVGINTAISTIAQNIGFAIPAARVRWVLSNQLLSPKHARSYLGSEIDEHSFVIQSVTQGSPAEAAGLAPGDRLTALGGRKLTTEQDYRFARVSLQANIPAEIELVRGSRTVGLTIEPWGVVEGFLLEKLGVRAESVPFGRRFETWVQLKWIDPDGPAGRIGLEPEDVILAVLARGMAPNRVRDVDTLALLLSRIEPGTSLEIEICRDEDRDGVYFERTECFRGKLIPR